MKKKEVRKWEERTLGKDVRYCKVKLTLARAVAMLSPAYRQVDPFCKDIVLRKLKRSKSETYRITCGHPEDPCSQQTIYKKQICLRSRHRR